MLGDGHWSLEEFEVYSRDLDNASLELGRDLLEQIDADGDGIISMEEVVKHLCMLLFSGMYNCFMRTYPA